MAFFESEYKKWKKQGMHKCKLKNLLEESLKNIKSKEKRVTVKDFRKKMDDSEIKNQDISKLSTPEAISFYKSICDGLETPFSKGRVHSK